jgi:antitoxin (DNA-binding transcriptional repressor) of toxin-antitoxin stability system
MKHVQLSDARERIADLLNEVERGQSVLISREGAPLRQTDQRWPEVTEEQRKRARIAMEQIKEARKTAPKASLEEILAWRDEGRR